MRRFLWLSLGALLLAGVVVASSGGATQAEARWLITNLGTLPGYSWGSGAVAINDRRQIVGWSSDGGYREHAFLWENGKMIDLGTFGGPETRALDINERGQVVGNADRKAIYHLEHITHAFLWQDGKMTDLGTHGSKNSQAVAINDRGQVVGKGYKRREYPRPYLWEKGGLRYLGSLGGEKGVAVDINERGQVVGWSGTGGAAHAFLWERGKIIDLSPMAGIWQIQADALNERGEVIGDFRGRSTSGRWHAFLWKDGKMRDLGTLGGPESRSTAINERGQVVGYADTRRLNQYGHHIWHAFLWENGKMVDLGGLGGKYHHADAINEHRAR